MQYPKCLDTRGLCDNGHVMHAKHFFISLPVGFEDRTFIPCFARKQVLKKLVVFSFQKTSAKPRLKTKHGFLLYCSLVNYKGKTFFTGPTWREFAKVYKFQVGMKLYFDISTHGPQIDVDLDNVPIVHSSYYAMLEETQEIVDNMELTAGTTCTWKEMRYVIIFADSIDSLVRIYAHEPSSAPYKLLMHTLTETNIKKKLLRLPSRVLPDQMDRHGEMRIIIYPDTDIWSIYSTPEKDGRLIVLDGWKDLLSLYKMAVGDKLPFVIHQGGDEVILFVKPMPGQSV